ncbi:MAG: class I SAM-dependent methyltransferase [Patescibacteria group bacterium]
MSNVALSSANQNTTQTNFTQLDIGGGPDADPNLTDTEYYKDQLGRAHSVLLAKSNPDGSYIVFDPVLEMEAAKQVEADTPNVAFIKGQVDKDHRLPFNDDSMDIIEVNHLVSPLMMEANIRPEVEKREATIEEKRAEFEHEWLSPDEVQERLRPYSQAVNDFVNSKPKQLFEEGIAEDFQDYLAVVEEAARVLKPNGKLVLGEKWSRIKPIVRIISKDDRLQCDGEIMDKLGLEFFSLTDNDDPHRSGYANSAAGMRDFRIESGDMSGAEEMRPVILTLQKRTSG